MRRLGKLLGMIFIFGIVFFIICDEKGYKIDFKNNHIVFNKTEIKPNPDKNLESKLKFNLNTVYKNSDLIYINYEFEDPKTLRKSDGMDPKYLAKLEEEKRIEKEKIEQEKRIEKEKIEQEKKLKKERKEQEENLEKEKNKQQEKMYDGPSIISLSDDTISSVFVGKEIQNSTGTNKKEININTGKNRHEVKINTGIDNQEVKTDTGVISNNTSIDSRNNTVEKPIIYHKVEKYSGKQDLTLNLTNGKEPEQMILYKNSNIIRIYSGFEHPWVMRRVIGIDEEFLAKQKEIQNEPNMDEDTILGAFNPSTEKDNNSNKTNESNFGNNSQSDEIEIVPNENIVDNTIRYKVEKYEPEYHSFTLKNGIYTLKNNQESIVYNTNDVIENITENTGKIDDYEENYTVIEKPELSNHSVQLSRGIESEIRMIKIERYQFKKHNLNLKKGKAIKHNFVLSEDSMDLENMENGISNPILESLLENEEIDINALESENDEFLQRVFEKTKDVNVMNLIVETYLSEYQFVKAKKFIENLPEMYRDELKPLLHLRVAFNSFALTSKTINENLTSLVQDYASKNEILEEDKNRYMGVIALMDQDYDHFFEIANDFKSDKHQEFTAKLQGYKDQISKQMGMPEYYFDTLVSLELFNQGLFQPAKIIALYSLQQNPNYILPYQVLAYANFLTNSRDTSIEYLKKLVDLDPNNSEKYRFLMGVAYYRDEKYEQSVVMLSMIKDENLRLDAQRYLINDYIKLNQKNKLISSRNKLLGYENLVSSDFYTYFYETFYHPYSEGEQFQIYAFDTELANKMLRVCALKLSNEEKVVCTYGTIGKSIAVGQFEGLENLLLDLVAEYPQGYLYHALGEYYVKQGDLEKAKIYLLKAVSLTQERSERSQIKKLLQDTM